MKKNILRNTILTVAVSSAVAVPTFAQTISAPIMAEDIKIVPISYMFNHWAETYVDQLSINFDVEEIFKDKNLDDYITAEDFKNAVKVIFGTDYESTPESVTREAIVYELTKIWAEKVGKNIDLIPIVRMLIYSDTSDIDTKYLNGVYVAYMQDIAKGKGQGVFDPKTNVTYGELAVLLNNTINAVEKELTSNNQPIVKGRYETKGNYEVQEDKVIFNFELMSHYTEAQTLMFSSGQQFEVTITNEEGEEVYRFSDGKFFTEALIYKTLNPGESIKWQDEWDMTNKNGEKLTSDNYKAEIKIMTVSEEEKTEEEQLTTVMDFTINN